MTHPTQLLPCLLTGAACVLALSARADLIHRYSFNETSGTTVDDSVGTADGTLKGNGGYFDSGRLYLPGGGGSAATPDVIAGYVDLPNHIINVLNNVTVETWVMWDGTTGAWQRIFDFGTSAGGEDVVNGNGTYLFLSPAGAANLRFAVRDLATGGEPTQLTAPAPLTVGENVCLTVTYDAQANVSRLYSNAVLVVTGTATVPLSSINDVNNWLGRSQWDDGMFMGNYDEFRIYDAALDPVQVAASYLAGPAQPSTDPASLGVLQSVNLSVPKSTMTEQDTQTVSGSADYANFPGLALAGVPGVTLVSDKPDVVSVDAAGLVTALKPGVAKLTLSYGGKSDEETINVNKRQTGIVVAGALAVDLRAADTSTDATVWKNRAVADGSADFSAVGTPTYIANVEGTSVAGVRFNVEAPNTDAYVGPATTAELTGSSDRSIEVWAYNPVIADEETLVAWSRRGGPDGSNMSFNYGANAGYGAVGHWGGADMGWSGTPAAGRWHYLVYTYDGVNTARVFADGKLRTSRTTTLATHPDFLIRIGAQANTGGDDFDLAQALSGYLAMVRVHTGQLSAADVENNFLYGPTLTPPGDLQTVTLELSATTFRGPRFSGQARVVADFVNLKGVDVIGFSTVESSDPTVVSITPAGVYTALKVGTATITATYQGRPASQAVTVTEPPATDLMHRYSFNEAPGATLVKDSEGTADGQLKGNGGDFTGTGQLSLPGGTGSAADAATIAGYVDLPNHIVSPLVNATFETWITWQGSGVWERIFDLGTSAGGEDVVNGSGAYLFLSPAANVNLRFAVRDPITGAETPQLTSTAPLNKGEEIHLAAVYDFTRNESRLYSNAVQVVSGAAPIPLAAINDVNNWLGRSQWDDAMFQGSYNEFRIWEGALSAEQVAANFAAGANTLPDPTVTPEFESIVKNADGTVTLSWTGGGTLQATDSLAAPIQWTDLVGATSPYKFTPAANQKVLFARIKQ